MSRSKKATHTNAKKTPRKMRKDACLRSKIRPQQPAKHFRKAAPTQVLRKQRTSNYIVKKGTLAFFPDFDAFGMAPGGLQAKPVVCVCEASQCTGRCTAVLLLASQIFAATTSVCVSCAVADGDVHIFKW
jgi:hypothetical protein